MKDRQTSSSLTGPYLCQHRIGEVEQATYDYEVPVSNPTAQCLMKTPQLDPVLEFAINDSMLKDWSCEEYYH
jgi:hypothetical protein